eukprot:747165-Hanusia_phi.AAC.1
MDGYGHAARRAGEGAYASTGGSDHAARTAGEGAYASTGGGDQHARRAGEGAYSTGKTDNKTVKALTGRSVVCEYTGDRWACQEVIVLVCCKLP